MNYQSISKDNLLNGPGIRTVLWVSGCNHQCKNCHNPETWDPNSGMLFDENAKSELFENLKKDYVKGITFSGGDPLFPGNRETITNLAKEIKEKFPNKTIWCYTGFLYEKIKDLEIMKYLDVLVDGPFVESLKNPLLNFRGSSNQRIINIQETIKKGEIVLSELND